MAGVVSYLVLVLARWAMEAVGCFRLVPFVVCTLGTVLADFCTNIVVIAAKRTDGAETGASGSEKACGTRFAAGKVVLRGILAGYTINASTARAMTARDACRGRVVRRRCSRIVSR
jgi:hypothetical protein